MKTLHFVSGLLVCLLLGLVSASPDGGRQQRDKPTRRSKSNSNGNSNYDGNAYQENPGQRKFNQNWSALDREIFHLNEQIRGDAELGPATTFYSWLEIPKRSTQAEITKAYKQLSRRIHPDKVTAMRDRAYKAQLKEQGATKVKPQTAADRRHDYKLATDRFARLGLVYKILSDATARERYDFFLDHGFPKLKGADYFYSRYRPGVLFVAVFLYLLVGVGQLVSQKVTASQQRRYMTAIITDAKALAWPSGVPAGNPRNVVLDNGKEFRVYPDGRVFLLEDRAPRTEYLLDVAEIAEPSWRATVLYTLPRRLLATFMPADELQGGKKLGRKDAEPATDDEEKSEESVADKKPAAAKPATKLGGRRRK